MKLLSPLGKDFYLSNTVWATGMPSKGGGIFTMEFYKVEHNRIMEKVDGKFSSTWADGEETLSIPYLSTTGG